MESGRVTWSHIQDLVANFETLLEVLRLLELRQLGVEGRRVNGRLNSKKMILSQLEFESSGKKAQFGFWSIR